MKKVQQGFTLIELMIVVAIIGILAAIAIPAYQDYTQRAQIGEAFAMISGAKTGVAEFAQTNGDYPTDAQLTALELTPINGTYAQAVVAGGTGIITVTMGNGDTSVGADINGQAITFTPPQDLTAFTGTFEFECASGIAVKFLPSSCQ